jgi:translocation and assembly module TamA
MFVLGCGGKAHPKPTGNEWLVGVRIEGNTSIDDDELIPKLGLSRALNTGRAIDPYTLSLDNQRITAAYLRIGFFDIAVKSHIARRAVGPNRIEQTAVFAVTEGRRSTIRVVTTGLEGLAGVSEDRARRLVELPDGAPFDYDVYDTAKLPLLALVESAGYAHVQMDAAVIADRSAGVATTRYAFEPGPRCTFGAYTVTGVTGDLATAIAHRIAFAPGDVYSPAALAQTQRALYALGRFSTVQVVARRDPAGLSPVVPVDITVALANRHEIKLGGGFGYEPLTLEARARAGGSLIPLDHPLWTLFADARVAAAVDHHFDNPEPKIRVNGTAQRLDLFRPRLSGEVGAGFDYATVEAYTSKGPQLRLGLSSPLGVPWLSLRVGWAFSYLDFDAIQVDDGTATSLGLRDADGGARPQRLGMFQQALIADLRDDPIDPRNGVYFALRANEGTPYAGSTSSFVQLTPDLRGYLALGTPRLVLALRLRVGAIIGDDVPVTERYFSGGAQSHRGFSERHLSPLGTNKDPDGDPVLIGGAGLIETGGELRIALGTLGGVPIGTTLFLDGGEVTYGAYDLPKLTLIGLHWAAGVGISAKLGQLKVRLDVGHRLNRTASDEPQYEEGTLANTAFHFGVGDTF